MRVAHQQGLAHAGRGDGHALGLGQCGDTVKWLVPDVHLVPVRYARAAI